MYNVIIIHYTRRAKKMRLIAVRAAFANALFQRAGGYFVTNMRNRESRTSQLPFRKPQFKIRKYELQKLSIINQKVSIVTWNESIVIQKTSTAFITIIKLLI